MTVNCYKRLLLSAYSVGRPVDRTFHVTSKSRRVGLPEKMSLFLSGLRTLISC